MKTLIIYYSRDGHTRIVADVLALQLKADSCEIKEPTSRAGLKGWLRSGKEAWQKKITEIIDPEIDPAKYDLVVIGTPIWASTMSCAVRSWLTKYGKQLPKKIAFFATMNCSGDKKAFRHMEELCSKTPIATAAFIAKKVAATNYQEQLAEFAKKLK